MLEVACRGSFVSRDGRPFGAGQGNRMRSLDWLLPSMLAGSLRTTIGKAADRDFSAANAQNLLEAEIAGPFPISDGQLYLPAPRDCVLPPESGGRPLRAAPYEKDGGGCDWPEPGLRPVGLTPEQAPDEFKPEEAPAWWPVDDYAVWLAGGDITF